MHRYDMTEVDYGGGGAAHGWERSTDQLVCLEVPPAPVYKGVEEGAGQEEEARPRGGGSTPTGSRTPPFPIWRGRRKEEE